MDTDWAVRIAVSSSGRNNKVGMGGVVRIPLSMRGGPRDDTFKLTLGPRTEQNPYSAVLAAVGHALRLLRKVRHRRINLATSNKAAVLTMKNPRQQSGQHYACKAYDAMKAAWNAGNPILIVWIPTTAANELLRIAKVKAKEATERTATPQAHDPGMRSTTLCIAWAKRTSPKALPDK
jgi:ribonuclease HI